MRIAALDLRARFARRAALRIKSAATQRFMSELMDEAVTDALAEVETRLRRLYPAP